MTQPPPPYPAPSAGGPWPAAGGLRPGHPPAGYPPQPYPGLPPGYGPPPAGFRPPPPPPVSPAGQPLASFADRLLAFLVDCAVFALVGTVLAVPAVIILMITTLPELSASASDGTVEPAVLSDFFVRFLLVELGIFAVSMILGYVYYVEMMFRTGQTVGKKVMKIKVTPLDPAGTLDRGMAAKRWLVESVASGLVPGLGLLDGLWQLWDQPYQQCLHDKFAGTVVVKVPG